MGQTLAEHVEGRLYRADGGHELGQEQVPLPLAASVSQKDALVTPEAIRLVRQAGYKTVLGVSNVSYGLPGRDELNCAYLSACLAAGLLLPGPGRE